MVTFRADPEEGERGAIRVSEGTAIPQKEQPVRRDRAECAWFARGTMRVSRLEGKKRVNEVGHAWVGRMSHQARLCRDW